MADKSVDPVGNVPTEMESTQVKSKPSTKNVSGGVDIKELLEAGAHFGHKTSSWHPAMKPFIHSRRGDNYIIDLTETVRACQKNCCRQKNFRDFCRSSQAPTRW
jgi:hypothetical protein